LPLTVFSFLIMLCDKKTRRAVNAFNFYVRDHPDELKDKCQELGLLQRIFGPDPNYPGPTHQIIFRIAGMVMMIAVLAKRQEIAMLAFESAFLAGLGAMMMLKRNGWGQPD